MTDLPKLSTYATVGLVEEIKQRVHKNGVGAEAVFEEETVGWQLCLVPKLTLVLQDKPPFEAGDRVKLSLEKLP